MMGPRPTGHFHISVLRYFMLHWMFTIWVQQSVQQIKGELPLVYICNKLRESRPYRIRESPLVYMQQN